jgi:hypothetical protein
MAGYVPGYLYLTNIAAWRQVAGGNEELYEKTINGIILLVPNGVTPNFPYGSSGPNGFAAGNWWVTGDVSQYGAVNTEDSSTPTRNLVSQAYNTLFNRFPGVQATEFWTDQWRFRDAQTKFGSVLDMIRDGGSGPNGESQFIASTPYAIPYTLYAPQFGCTTVGASNYQAPAPLQTRLFTSPVILTGGTCTFPPTASLSASPTSILYGGSSTLTWSTSNATSISISGIGAVASSGTRTVSPTQTTNYTLTATGSGTATSSVTVTVINKPYVKSNGVWKIINSIYIKDAGSWKLCSSAYIKSGGVWKKFI